MLNLGATQANVLDGDAHLIINGLDRSLLARLSEVIEEAERAFGIYDYARALDIVETFFWSFTDDYVELIKDRAYGARGEAEQASVLAALATTLDAVLRLFAPFLPFATEEVWSWWRTGSVHQSAWPTNTHLTGAVEGADTAVLPTVGDALGGIRKSKSEAKVKQRTQVLSGVVRGPAVILDQVRAGLGDLLAAGNAVELDLQEGGEELVVSDVVLAPAEEPATQG
ncbi:MAG: valine--tRNA ligase [Micrococcaceae bacterium]|nr:valine--tRNA ligase [Micrococcaceae bacterium]